jgi:16S rRNA (cytosine1402-N4)-methyltransferase
MAALPRVLANLGLAHADAIVADLGCSSMQLDDPARGFSYKGDGPLDLRMNPRKGRPASAWLAAASAERLALTLEANADEPRAERLARAIVSARERAPLQRTSQLAAAVRGALPPSADASATIARVFQALRIAVNDELSTLDAFLRALPACLAPAGRVAILTFHSGEDRRVKRAFSEGWRHGAYAEIAREVVRPGRQEIRGNPRAGSAKLRWAIRSAEP